MKYHTLSEYRKKNDISKKESIFVSDEDTAFEISNKIIKLRLKKCFTQKRLAEIVGTQQSSIARIESGNYLPSISFLNKVARACEVHLEVDFKQNSNNSGHDSETKNVFFANEFELAQESRIVTVNTKTSGLGFTTN